MNADSIAWSLYTFSVSQHGVHGETHSLAIAQYRDLDWLVLGFLQHVNHRHNVRHRLPIYREDDVSDLDASLFRGHSAIHLGNNVRLLLNPTQGSILFESNWFGNHCLFKFLVATLDDQIERLIGAKRNFGHHLLPGGIFNAVNPRHAIARLNAGLGGWRVGQHPANDCRLVQKNRILVTDHVDGGEQPNRQEDVHGGPGYSNNEALPARVGEELAGIPGALVHGILTRHLHVATQRDGTDAVIGLTLAETQQASAKTN